MKNPKYLVEQADIDYALNSTPWDLGNQVLYDMCAAHPQHPTHQEVVSKVWLIGRSYAAAIERRKNKKNESDKFYEEIVGPGICNSDLDKLLSNLPASPADAIVSVASAIITHKEVTNLFNRLAKMEKRSLASKYLHFHRPDIFFIYDARAQTAINKLTPDCRYIDCINIPETERDEWYYKFCVRACWLIRHIKDTFHQMLTPRQIDKVLLNVNRRIRISEPSLASDE